MVHFNDYKIVTSIEVMIHKAPKMHINIKMSNQNGKITNKVHVSTLEKLSEALTVFSNCDCIFELIIVNQQTSKKDINYFLFYQVDQILDMVTIFLMR